VKDNLTKAILHHAILPDGSSVYMKKLLTDTFEHQLYRHPHTINIMNDSGSENKGDLLNWINDNENARKIIAQKDLPFTNNKSESIHHTFKGEFMGYKTISDERALKNNLAAICTILQPPKLPY